MATDNSRASALLSATPLRSRISAEQTAELMVLQGELTAAISGAIVRLLTAAWEARPRDARSQAERLIMTLSEAADAVRGAVS